MPCAACVCRKTRSAKAWTSRATANRRITANAVSRPAAKYGGPARNGAGITSRRFFLRCAKTKKRPESGRSTVRGGADQMGSSRIKRIQINGQGAVQRRRHLDAQRVGMRAAHFTLHVQQLLRM